jgi:hypothetical protein
MADTHEEQLLSDLLGAIARDDAHLDARHLEARVLEAASRTSHNRSIRWTVWVGLPGAAVVVLTLATTLVERTPVPAPASAGRPKLETTAAIEQPPQKRSRPAPRARSGHSVRGVRRQPHSLDPGRAEPRERAAAAEPQPPPQLVDESPANGPIEFVPLLPITEQELTGSFQIVRIQMPNASLGPLRSPLQPLNDLVEADVLLGEDGRARAIRLNTNGSIYPWRSR